MIENAQAMDSLPADRAFIIQFRSTASDGSARFQGRVEHLVSGQAECFLSREELWQVLEQLLTQKAK
jgi:hypothetical protein